MTDEASAAVRGILAYEPGASVVVCDAHAGFRNLLPDRLARGCTLLRGSPRTHSMLTGIDGEVDLEIDVLRPFMTERACLIPGSSCGLRSLSAFTPPTSRPRTT
jgi:D-aminopeptidase